MRKLGLSFITLTLVFWAAHAADPAPKTVQENWDVVYVDGVKAGYVQTQFSEIDRGGRKLRQAVTHLRLTLKREHDTVQMKEDNADVETLDGKVLGIAIVNYPGKEGATVRKGTVKEDHIDIVVTDANGKVRGEITKPWNPRVVGIRGQEHLYSDRKVQPGDVFSYESFVGELTVVMTMQVEVKDYDTVRFLSTHKEQRLLRALTTSEPIGDVSLPPMTVWLNERREPVRTSFVMKGFGTLVLERTSRAVATGAVGTLTAGATNIGYTQLIPLNRRLPHGLNARAAVYHITVQGDRNVMTAFAHDNRQEIRNVHGNSFDLYVHPIQETADPAVKEPGKEFLAGSYYVNNDDPRVRELARRAVGSETDPWKKAQRVARWVFQHMHSDYEVGFDTAEHVARTLEGDCTEHSVLAAAMCKAVGIPSRTAIGLVYFEKKSPPKQGPVLGFHMWAEVWINGQWRGIDPTMGSPVGAGHLKITDHSWYRITSLQPLLPLQRVLGNTRIELVRIGEDE